MILQVVEHRLAEGESARLGPVPRVLYSVEGHAAGYARGPQTVAGPAHTLAFELVPEPSPNATLSAAIQLPAPALIRCDRVDFPPGGVAYLHTHQGPGIRVLLRGEIRVDTDGQSHRYEPLEAWFEPGPEPVFAAASDTEPTAFVRCMVLPGELIGKRSIRYVRDEDAAKPKPQQYTVFVDQLLDA